MFMVKTMTVAYYLQALYGLAFSLSVVFCSIADTVGEVVKGFQLGG